MTFGPSDGWVFCGADERRNVRSHFRHRFCRCAAAPPPPRTDRKKDAASEPATTSVAPVTVVRRPPESEPVESHQVEKARGGDDDDDYVLSREEKQETRQRLLPNAVECRILALLDLASHVSAMRTSTVMRRLCAHRLASPRVVALTGMCREWRGSYLHSYADGDDAGRRPLDDEDDALETRLELPWFERRYASRGRLPDPTTLSDTHALLKRQWAPRVLDLYAVRFDAASFEALLHAMPTVAVLCVDASHVSAIATVVGRHLPALVSLHLYDGFRYSASSSAASSSPPTESVDSYGDWHTLSHLVNLTLPLTIELAAHLQSSSSDTAADSRAYVSDSKRSASTTVTFDVAEDDAGADCYLPPTLERLTLTRAETTHVSRMAPTLDYARLLRSLPRLRHFRTAHSMPGVDALRTAPQLETLDGGQFTEDNDEDRTVAASADSSSSRGSSSSSSSSSTRTDALTVRRLDWRTSSARRPRVYVTDLVAPHRVERASYSVELRATEIDLGGGDGGGRRAVGMTPRLENMRDALVQLTSLSGLRHLVLHGATQAVSRGVFELLCNALLRLEHLEVSSVRHDGGAFEFRPTIWREAVASADALTAPTPSTPTATASVPNHAWRNATEAFFAPLEKLVTLQRLDFHNMPRRGGCSFRRDIFPGRAATAPKDEIWHLPPLPQMRDYRQLHWTASVAAVLASCPGLTTLHVSFEALVGNTRTVELAVRHATLRTLRLENVYAVEDRTVEHGVVALILKLGHRRMRHGAPNSDQKSSSSPSTLPRRTLTIEGPGATIRFRTMSSAVFECKKMSSRRVSLFVLVAMLAIAVAHAYPTASCSYTNIAACTAVSAQYTNFYTCGTCPTTVTSVSPAVLTGADSTTVVTFSIFGSFPTALFTPSNLFSVVFGAITCAVVSVTASQITCTGSGAWASNTGLRLWAAQAGYPGTTIYEIDVSSTLTVLAPPTISSYSYNVFTATAGGSFALTGSGWNFDVSTYTAVLSGGGAPTTVVPGTTTLTVEIAPNATLATPAFATLVVYDSIFPVGAYVLLFTNPGDAYYPHRTEWDGVYGTPVNSGGVVLVQKGLEVTMLIPATVGACNTVSQQMWMMVVLPPQLCPAAPVYFANVAEVQTAAGTVVSGSVYVPSGGNVQIHQGVRGSFSTSGAPVCGLAEAVSVTWILPTPAMPP